jgi:hypothetical protein
MAKIHVLLQRGAGGPDDRRAAGSWLSSDSESAVKGITKSQSGIAKRKKTGTHPGFLAKSNTYTSQITATDQPLPNFSQTTT